MTPPRSVSPGGRPPVTPAWRPRTPCPAPFRALRLLRCIARCQGRKALTTPGDTAEIQAAEPSVRNDDRVRFYADLHIHSRYSRACSRDCDLEHLAWWAGRKGIALVGTGDFTHPAWREELGANLVPAEPGLFRLRPELERAVASRLPAACRTPVRFMLSAEISTIYKRDGRTRKVHHLLYAPSLPAVDEITRRL